MRPDPSLEAGTAIFRFVGDWATENTLQLTGFSGGKLRTVEMVNGKVDMRM